ncbi:MAG: hypothetical protein CV087_23355 [Candidatus Brocadia sp. WS118]|nr:MAG: hypothetical protein CV087_23355 [Candidatus Brocadia sp. WS118]
MSTTFTSLCKIITLVLGLVQKIKKHPYIVSLKTHCGGSPVIAGTKFPVRSVVFYILRQGMTPEELVKEFSHLTLPQIYDALFYYYENKEKIDKELAMKESDLRQK